MLRAALERVGIRPIHRVTYSSASCALLRTEGTTGYAGRIEARYGAVAVFEL